MLPYLDIAGFQIPMYSLMIVIGVIFGGLYFFLVTFKEEKFSELTLKRLFISIILSAICLVVGASLFDSLFHSIEEGQLVIGGITWLGGVVVAFPAFVLLSNLLIPDAKGRAMKFVSLLIPSIVLAHAFGRIGCFCGGCCYGKVTDSIFGVKFPFLDEKVLPTQLFESIFDLILFTVMAVFRKKIKYHNFEIYFMAYGTFRFFIEFLRGDDRGATNSVLSPAQLLSIAIIVAGIIITYRYVLKNKINRQLSVSNREDGSFLFATTEEFQLKLSWRNGAIVLTSLVLILFITGCGCDKSTCASCANLCGLCACPGCYACNCICSGKDEMFTETSAEDTKEGLSALCSNCKLCYEQCECGDLCSDVPACFSACNNDCSNFCAESKANRTGAQVGHLFISIKNSLSAFLSFAKEMMYHK